MHESYKDYADIFMVYISEAHPGEKVSVGQHGSLGLRAFPKSTSLDESRERAHLLAATLDLDVPMLADDQDRSTELAYNAWPTRLVVIDVKGQVAADVGAEVLMRTPAWAPTGVENWLDSLTN